VRRDAWGHNQRPNVELRKRLIVWDDPPKALVIGRYDPVIDLRQSIILIDRGPEARGVTYVKVSSPWWGWAWIFQAFWLGL
jgi:hypothetical protein